MPEPEETEARPVETTSDAPSETLSETPPERPEPEAKDGAVRLIIEIGPLVAFFVANSRYDLFVGTAVFMAAMVVSLFFSWRMEKRVPVMPLFTSVFVLVLGGLTLWLQDETFIKIKPTIANTFLGTILLVGLAFGRLFIKHVFGTSFALTNEGWRALTLRWGVFFYVLAVINEVVWRNFTDDQWVNFKVFGIMPLTLVFSVTQLPLLKRHSLEEAEA